MDTTVKIIILGYARHGKDTVAEILRDLYGLRFMSSSMFCSERICFPKLKYKYGYKTVEECYEDRVNHRAEWFDLIAEFNHEDEARLARELFQESDVYVGLRRAEELQACEEEGLFNGSVWVDASRRLPPEDRSSCTVTADMADWVIDNNGPLVNLHHEVKKFMDLVKETVE